MKVEQSYVIMAVSHFQEVGPGLGDVELVLTGLFQEGKSVKQPLIMPVAKGTSDEEQMVQKIMTAAGRFVSQQQGLGVSILPKLKKMRELQAQGVILHTIWDFSEKGEKEKQRKKKEAEKWLRELYPRIKEQIPQQYIEEST